MADSEMTTVGNSTIGTVREVNRILATVSDDDYPIRFITASGVQVKLTPSAEWVPEVT